MTMRMYTSFDASAPTLQGIVGGAYSSGWADGSLLELLRKVLVVGYGSKTAAGWTLPYTGTSKGVFKLGAGTGLYMRVLDDGTMTAGAREAQFYGGVTASDVDTLTATFPLAAQVSGFLKFRKSDTADSTQRQWICFADSRTFYLFSWTGLSGTSYYSGMGFGDFYSFFPNDTMNCLAIGRQTSAAVDSSSNELLDVYNTTSAGLGNLNSGHWMAGGYNQVASSLQFAVYGGFFNQTGNISGRMGNPAQPLPYPNPADNSLWLARNYVIDVNGTNPSPHVRGYLRGLWVPQHAGGSIPFNFPFVGAGSLAGKTFQVLGLQSGGGGRYTMETSDTWDTN